MAKARKSKSPGELVIKEKAIQYQIKKEKP